MEDLGGAVDEEVEVFHDDRPDQGVGSVRLDEGGEDTLPAQQLHPDILDQRPGGGPAVGVTHGRLAGGGQAELVDGGFGQDQPRRAGVDDAPERDAADLVGGQAPEPSQHDIVIHWRS